MTHAAEEHPMGTLNLANRTFSIMDDYQLLHPPINECIDLIAIDPPFAANETFANKPLAFR